MKMWSTVRGLVLITYFSIVRLSQPMCSLNFYSFSYMIPELDATSNAVCNLSLPNKIRLCATVLNARSWSVNEIKYWALLNDHPWFPEKVKFWPTEANIEECTEKKVVATAELGEKYRRNFEALEDKSVPENVEMRYNEWMLGCKVHLYGNRQPVTSTYYISHAQTSLRVIVFKESTTEQGTYFPYFGVRYVHMLRGQGKMKAISYKPIVPLRMA